MHSDSPDDELDMRAAQEAILGTRDEALDDDELDMLEAQEALLGARDAGAQSAGESTNKTEFLTHEEGEPQVGGEPQAEGEPQVGGESTNKTEFLAHEGGESQVGGEPQVGRERRGGSAAAEADFHGIDEQSSMDVGNKALIVLALAVMVVAAVYIANSWLHFI